MILTPLDAGPVGQVQGVIGGPRGPAQAGRLEAARGVAVLTEAELNSPAAAANRGKSSPRLFIADPGLEGLGGHHLAYSSAVAAAALKRGLEVVVLTSRNFRGTLGNPRIVLRPAFTARYQTSGGGGTARSAIFGAASYLPAPRRCPGVC